MGISILFNSSNNTIFINAMKHNYLSKVLFDLVLQYDPSCIFLK